MQTDLLYSTVTNLTVFNQEILDFILDANMWLYISIDGNKESHDLNRVNKDNKGSFDNVFKNINKIIKSAPEYAKNRVILQSVLANNTSEKEIKQFIQDKFKIESPEITIKKSLTIPQRVEKEYLSKYQFLNAPPSDYIENFRKILKKIEAYDKDELKTFLKYNSELNSMIENVLLIEKSLVFDNPKGIAKANKMFSCPLGTDSIFVSLNGNIHCCNKVDYSFPIGDIHDGLDVDKLTNIYKNYHQKVNDKCSDCWAYTYCKMCPAMVIYSEIYYLPKNTECEQIKLQFEVQLKSYIVLNEEFTNLYDRLNDIYYNKDVDLLTYSQPIDINNI